ncbi:MAG: penicillin-binding protein 1A, partial [Gammaproteobacteria bacterium]
MKHNPDRSVLSRKLRSAATAIGSFYAGCKEFVAAQYAYLVQKCTSIAHYALLHLKQLWLHAKRWGRMGLARLQIWRGSGKWLASFWRQSVWPWICKTARWIGYWIARGAQRAYIFYKSTALPALRVMRAKPWFRAGVTVSSLVVQLGLLAASGLAMVLATAFLYFSPRIPVADSLLQVQLPTPLKIYTADSKLIGEFGEQKRSPIQYEDLPPLLVQAFLAAEDDDFFSHAGVDIYALGRATWQLISSGGQIRSGGGTITMQVARHYLLSRDRTFYRKFREVLLAIELEQRFSKKQLMEFYLNGVFFGNRAYGIRAASQVYFDRDPKDLTLAQIALLVALPKAPSRLNPFRSPARALVRRNWVLRRMLFLGYIDQQTYDLAVATPVRLADDEYVAELDARYVAEMARIELVNRFGPQIYRNNYRAYTTIDSRMQQAAAKALANGLKEHDKRHGWRRPDSLKEYFSISSLEKIAKRDLTDFGELEQLLSQDEALEQDEGVLDLLDRLGEFPTIGNQRPLLVLLVDPAQFWALSPEARIEVFDWQEQRLSWARPRLEADGDPDVLGAQPRDFQDLLDTGDVIYADYSDTDSQPFLIQLPETEGAVVSLDPRSGAILSLQGGFSFQRSKFNRATQAKVQPGSALKPFLYLGALEFDNTPATIYDDAPVVFEDYSLEERWRPKNSSGRFLGPVRLREALVHSLNMVSIRLLESIGIEKLHTYISDTFGFAPEQMPKNLS